MSKSIIRDNLLEEFDELVELGSANLQKACAHDVLRDSDVLQFNEKAECVREMLTNDEHRYV